MKILLGIAVFFSAAYLSLVLPHGALDPCTAAGNKVYNLVAANAIGNMSDDPYETAGTMLGLAMGKGLAQSMARSKGIDQCLFVLLKPASEF